jgi:hypothetical protein
MNAHPSPGSPPAPRSAATAGLRHRAAFLALTLLAVCGRVAAEEPVQAVWKAQKLLFFYRSSISVYSCDALRTRVASLLYAVGARPDLQVDVSGCSEAHLSPDTTTIDRGQGTWGQAPISPYRRPVEFQQVVNIEVRLSMPVMMTPDVVREMESDKSRRELISRVTGNPLARFNDPIPFAAERRVVTLSHKTVGLEPAECELLDQLVSSTFRRLGIRVLTQSYSCDRNRISRIPPMVEVEVLVPASFVSGDDGSAPATRGEEPDPSVPATPVEGPAAPAADTPPE